jgi:hypothetical protein
VYQSRSAGGGSISRVSAKRRGRSTLTSLRRCLTITSAVRLRSAAAFFGASAGDRPVPA